MSDETHYENMLFNYETSARTYYRDGEIKPIIRTVYKEKPPCYRIRPPPLGDMHSLVDWKDGRVPPFNLFHKSKDIVRTNPWDDRQCYAFEKPVDVDLENVKKTRPRVFMTPAVSLDDVPPEARKLLVDEIYTTSAQRAVRNSVSERPKASVKAPLPAKPAHANPFILRKVQPPYVSPEWRMESASWDRSQLRAYCKPTEEFFLARTTKCDACAFTAAREAKMKLEKQMKKKTY